MPTFDFLGADITATGSDYDNGAVEHNATPFTEQGISFTFTSTGGSVLGDSSFPGGLNIQGDGPGAAETATLRVVDTDLGESFLSNIAFDIVSYSNAFGDPIRITLINTVDPTANPNVTITLPGTTFNSNYTIPATSGEFNVIRFTKPDGDDYLTLTSITADVSCFTAGTRIATPDGSVAVEDIEPGDILRTTTGTTRVKWLGLQFVDTRLCHPARINPIRIAAGAVGHGLPERDLSVSGDHGLAIDGVLYDAAALVNGTSITQMRRMPGDGFTYYHIETGAHELLLAEGVAAESFIEYATRDSFDNAADAPGGTVAEMAMPRVSSSRMVPAALRDRLMALSLANEVQAA